MTFTATFSRIVPEVTKRRGRNTTLKEGLALAKEKVLDLQKTKRELADAIIKADTSLIRSLGREELELLLS